jgi:predicted DNA-binding protein (MmcQ/YjbR family)
MEIDELREFCLSFEGITEETPFGPDNLVYKVKGKMYALIPLDSERPSIVLKNDPDRNEALKAEHSYINEAYHFNKVHWIAIDNTSKNPALSKTLISESYWLVRNKLPKKLKLEFEE